MVSMGATCIKMVYFGLNDDAWACFHFSELLPGEGCCAGTLMQWFVCIVGSRLRAPSEAREYGRFGCGNGKLQQSRIKIGLGGVRSRAGTSCRANRDWNYGE
jgi:hypothetical protein